MADNDSNGSIIGAAINTGGNLAAAAGSIVSQALFGKRNEEWAREDATTAYNRQRTLLAEQRAYESPAAQMQRYIDAGLNPNLIYGQQQGSIGAPSVPQAQTARMQGQGIPQDMFGSIYESQLMKAQIRNLESQSNLSEAEAYRVYKITPVEFNKIQADADRINQIIQSEEYKTKVELYKSQLFDDNGENYITDGPDGPIVDTFRGLIMKSEINRLYSNNLDYEKAIQLFETEIGIRKSEKHNLDLQNKDLEEFVKVCARIYESDAAQADYLKSIAELNEQIYGQLGASNEIIKLVYGFLDLLLGGVKSFTPHKHNTVIQNKRVTNNF